MKHTEQDSVDSAPSLSERPHVFSGEYSKNMWEAINAIPHGQVWEALCLIGTRLQEFEARVRATELPAEHTASVAPNIYESAVNGRRQFREAYRVTRAALIVADKAINPPDRSGISLCDWNERLKAATAAIHDALKTGVPAEHEVPRGTLLSCPFCGQSATIHQGQAFGKPFFWIACLTEDCLSCSGPSGRMEQEEQVIAAWNRRATDSSRGQEASIMSKKNGQDK